MPLTVCVIAFGAICAACGCDTSQTNLVHSAHQQGGIQGHMAGHRRRRHPGLRRHQGRLDHFLPGRQPRHLRGERDRDGLDSERGLKDFHEIWLDDPDGPGPKVNASDFDAERHKLCDMNK
jgi:hypothetical protein